MKRGVLIIFLVFSLLIISNADSVIVCQKQGITICTNINKYCTTSDAERLTIDSVMGVTNWCQCTTCDNPCSSGQKQCSGVQIQICTQSGSCWVWGAAQNCPSGQTCYNNACCTPATCSGKVCGSYSDGCGGTLNCGACSSGVCNPSGQCVLVEDGQACGANSQCRSGNCGGPNMLCTPADYQCYFNDPNSPEQIGYPLGYQDICTSDNSPWYTHCDSSRYCNTAPVTGYQCRLDSGVGKWLSACSGGTACDSATGTCKSQCVPTSGQPCTSSPNNCGQTNSGTYDCNGVCSASAPANVLLQTYYRDLDVDSYGDPLVSQTLCSQPAGYVTNAQDCNDANVNINPGKSENTQALCSDSLDNNCNSYIDCRDSSCSGITRTDGKKCCTSPTQCTNDQTCESNVCQTPSKIGNPTCCLTYSECLAAASKNSGNTLAWPQSADCVINGITERPECY